ncbi:STAS domain-containing protein [Streptomyces sviceus]|uniref:STAS domain-containing protein n=1 Tax=Streptomyces sviceus TaxID=285530 RepID=UPI00381AB47B
MLGRALLSSNRARPPRIVVDLTGVTFMDSSDVNVLVAAHKSMTDARGCCG